jgi:fluoride exporter
LRIFLIALFGALGTLARYGLQGAVQPRSAGSFPFGTLAVNLSGCLLLGFLGQLSMNRMVLSPDVRIAVVICFFGGYTTFSSFGWETVKMFEDGQWLSAGIYVLASVGVGVAFTLLGIQAANRI